MRIVLFRDEDLGDWYRVIRRYHDGNAWIERVNENLSRYMRSDRLSPESDIEGTSEELIGIARAIQSKSSVSFKRIAVEFDSINQGFLFYSPKNSVLKTFIDMTDSLEFMDQVFKEIGDK